MAIKVHLAGVGNGRTADVSNSGEMATAPLHYDETSFQELAVINTAYNFYLPQPFKEFVVTGVIAFADKQVSATTNATVVVYEASSSDTTTADKVLLQFELGQNQSIVATPLRILVNVGKFINAKTDDDDVHTTVMGYYIDIRGATVNREPTV